MKELEDSAFARLCRAPEEGLGFKESTKPVVLIAGANEQVVLEAFQRGRRDGYLLCQNALQEFSIHRLKHGHPINEIQECIDALARVQPPIDGVSTARKESK